MTGTTLTTSDNFLRTTMSMGLRLHQQTTTLGVRVARGLNKEKTAMDASILDVSITLSGKLLSEIRRMLIFDVFDNRVPTIS
jgi:hypothetical protein